MVENHIVYDLTSSVKDWVVEYVTDHIPINRELFMNGLQELTLNEP